jgi:CHAT domain-containing protein
LVAALVPSERGHTILSGPEATEAAVKNARGPRILHLATHGFFLPDQALGTAGTAPYEDALVRSGLALAGANRAGLHRSGDDGLLTALEIAGMDLSGTVLVVLSACDTGVGEVKSGEGVFGLRRAFALTGAQNLVMSLWPVDDAWTVRHMGHFYRSLRTMAPAAALRHAQLQTIQELAERLGGDAPPHLWAPFILQIGARFSGGAE